MSEQKQGYMAELDNWSIEAVIRPVCDVWRQYHNLSDEVTPEERDKTLNQIVAEAQKAIREKVFQSYRNGQEAGPAKRPFGKPRPQR